MPTTINSENIKDSVLLLSNVYPCDSLNIEETFYADIKNKINQIITSHNSERESRLTLISGGLIPCCSVAIALRIVADTLIYDTPKANRVYPDETAPTGAVSSGPALFANTSNHVTMSCSICTKKQNWHFIVPASRFKLLQGAENITTYTFNTGKAKHTFCKTCGVQSFYTPRTNQDGYGIMPHCLDKGTVESLTTSMFDGENWEEFLKKSDIQKWSKT